jgi:hypothetical protein
VVADTLVSIIHKKPKEGGITAVGGAGSIFAYCGPEEKKLRPDQERLHHRPAQGDAGARPRGGAHPALVDLWLRPRVAGGHGRGGREVDRGRVQLMSAL